MIIDDKSWTLLGRHEREFYIGLEKFVNHCKRLVNSVGKIRCPCKSCRTILWVSIKHLSDHITRHGFDLIYKTWVHHGEPALPLPPPVIDNTRQHQMSDMTALLNDLSYIPPNNEHNEPTQGDIGLQHVDDDIDDIQSTSVFIYEREFFMLTLLIPGPKSPGKDIDVYLRPLIEDLKVLRDRKGVETIDVASGHKFNIRAMILWTINDFFARSSLSRWSGKGYKAFPTCNKDTPYVHVLSKTTYVGYKRFLKKPHKWRSSCEFNGQTDNKDPPKEFGRDEILGQLDRLPTRLTGKHPCFGAVKIKRNVLVELNWTKRSIFYELEFWSFLTLRHNLDIMHIEKNMLEAILNTLLMNDKSKDTVKARQD
nr:hypothetical protein [Tanacetum cinerariifolium]